MELQSYVYEGRKLSALHLALGRGNCGWFEQPVSESDYQYELAVPVAMDPGGMIRHLQDRVWVQGPSGSASRPEALLPFDVEE